MKDKKMNNLLGTLTSNCETHNEEIAYVRQGIANMYPTVDSDKPYSYRTKEKNPNMKL